MIKASKRLISILICLTLVLAMLPMAVFAADTVTVYYYNATNWEKVCVHYWGTTAGGTTWPGNAMTDLGDGYWSFEVPADITGLVFNNNNKGAQTGDLALPTNGNNCYTGSEWITYTGEEIEVTINYYLRGIGTWDATEANKMTDNGDGTYSITMDLAAGTYQYKGAVADWSWSCPSGENAKLTLETDDTVTFTLNPAENTISYTLASGEVKVDYYLRGIGTWEATDANKMTDNGDGTYSITMSLAAGSYEYKAGTSDWSWSCPSGANAKVKLDCDCDVTFTLNVATNELLVEGDGIGEVDPMVIDYIVAVGTGSGNFLNGEEWNEKSTTNVMTKNESVYTITYNGVAAGDYLFKFAANGAWDYSWGTGCTVESGTEYDAAINGKDGTVTVAYNDSTVTLTLDLTNMDPVTGEGAKCTVTVVAPESPVEPEEPEEPESMVIQQIIAVGTGSGAFLNGEEWNPGSTSNVMTENEGVYTITYTGVAAGTYEFKFAANGAWALSWGTGAAVESGVEYDAAFNGGNGTVTVAYNDSTVTLTLDLTNMDYVTGAGAKCTVTIVAPENPGESGGVVEPDPMEIQQIIAVGTGSGAFLNGEEWNPGSTSNVMTENEGVYTITYSGVAAGTYEFKFAANGAWALSWGTGAAVESGVEYDANFNGQNSTVTVAYNDSTVTLTLDLTNMDYVTGAGAKCTVTIVDPENPGESGGAEEPDPMEIEQIVAVGTGREGFLNDITWDPAAAQNKMAENEGVYTITYDAVAAGTYEFKFAANGAWALSWGTGAAVESGVEYDAAFNGGNGSFEITAELAKVTLTLDLTEMDYVTGAGAKCTVTIEPIADEPVVDDGTKDIKFQTKDNSLRLVTWVDSLNYKEIVFNVTIGTQTAVIPCTTVYSSINAGGLKLDSAAAVFNENALYFVTYTINNVPASVTELQVSVTWTDLEGNTRTSGTRTINL